MVVPVFNESPNIEALYKALVPQLDSFLENNWEVLFVDDGSTDDTLMCIKALSAQDERVLGIALSRNFGHQVALHAGLVHARGEVVVTMDGDLQHPPQVIALLMEKHREGFDVVNTRRMDAGETPLLKKWTSRLFYRILNLVSDVPVQPDSSDFRLMSRKAVDAYLQFPERTRFTRGLIGWMGFGQSVVDYRAGNRHAGKTKFTWRKMMGLALDGFTSFSGKPLRFIALAGMAVFFFGLAYAGFAVIQHVLGQTVSGWTSLLISVWILGGLQLLAIGLISEYLLRIFHESKQRPIFFVREKIGKVNESDAVGSP